MIYPARLLFLICLLPLSLFSQKNVGNTYKAAGIADSTYGIIMYNALIGSAGGDSIRYDAMKLPLQGLVIDMYDNGQMLHKGSYAKGKLVSFNNYYPDGKKERSFVTLSGTMSNLKVFYENGKTRSEVEYRSGEAKRSVDYYENGQMEFYEEYSGDMAYLLSRKGFKENGIPDYELKLISSKNRSYQEKEFYPDGNVHQQGEVLYFANAGDMRKDGIWNTYNTKGNLILVEHYSKGEVTEKQDSIALLSSAPYLKQSAAAKKKQEEKQAKEDKKRAELEKKQMAADQKDQNKKNKEKEKKIADNGPADLDMNNDQLALNKSKEAPKEEPKVEVPNMKSTEKNSEESKSNTSGEKQKPDVAPTGTTNKKPAPKKTGPLVVPAEFKFADKNKNGKISAPEVSQAINAFFDDESGKLKPEDISKLIDYFFDQ